jgi:methionyl-tRNA formyltransferase
VRLVLAGTPAVAVPSLDALLASRHEVLAVLTRPDARAGRGRRGALSAVKERALAADLPVLQPRRPGDPDALAALRDLDIDCVPVVAYGALVPPAALAVPRHGWVNLHFSLLPAWRGAAPVQHALMAGDEVTGATTFRLDEGLDTGPVFGTLTEAVRPRDTAGTLLTRLAAAGANLLVATLDGIEAGTLDPRPQPDDRVSLAPRLAVDDARVDWRLPALVVDRRVRACTPAPGAWTLWRGERLKLGPVQPVHGGDGDPPAPGEVRVHAGQVLVGTGSGPVALEEVRPAGRREMPAAAWARGARPEPGERLG